jgi:hypothetical protein
MPCPPTFGSVGDIIAVTQIVTTIIRTIRNSKSSEKEYHQLLAELESLQRAFDHLDKLQNGTSSENSDGISIYHHSRRLPDEIRYAAVSCRQPLEDLLAKLQKYQKAMGERIDCNENDGDLSVKPAEMKTPWHMSKFLNKAEKTARKIQWQFSKEEFKPLQNYLRYHVNIINLLVTQHCLETMKLEFAENRDSHNKLKDMINATQQSLGHVSDDLYAQSSVVKKISDLAEKLLEAISQLNIPWKENSNIVTNIW